MVLKAGMRVTDRTGGVDTGNEKAVSGEASHPVYLNSWRHGTPRAGAGQGTWSPATLQPPSSPLLLSIGSTLLSCSFCRRASW